MNETLLALGLVGVLIPSVILHEVAHAWTADRFGDPTARHAGRVTLNPLRHIDPFGTIALPVVLALVAPFIIGFAKPVPVQPGNLRNPRPHMLIVALAGPATNFGLAAIAVVVFRAIRPDDHSVLWYALALMMVVNIVLGLFNLLPIPPLDGSAIIDFVLPVKWLGGWYRIRPYTLVVFLGVAIFGRSYLEPILGWAVDVWEAQQ